ncbi:MAG: 2Fe-2S iron-sulfur cluster binding domain-containing protein [Candidatus Thiodiazotropha sp. (ex Lucinoma borealis)]|nr:2Fe-2S iron-sulfur cluster binding domain-containing protein [Candidatus Thiodiazotropha sp. (ex Lucinoma borealis)]MCU7855027.1 2Fe-2S iron-sulfur cluster binding domain-containing protein [Candidatus Thiodiazotropha sp. (ex Lucinoma borealis)]MCU7864850.1 2Fe-2S iron-sulfur cluster binding domain-containing protein [Candidatus Thiodiazotropha sp. (ex Lucinoma borealis)]MCU7868491.1 2Fe-2S iron-sulfur cluster binding domain-containing protein [Candidatus Thiodiazotropha sp. (ex Lucinoma bore
MFGLFGKSKKDFQASIQPSGKMLEVQSGDNLLKAGLAAGLRWPHDCRVGSCGSCKCRLIEGKIKELADFAYVLDGEELRNGMILACQSQLKSDVVVEVEMNAGDDDATGISTASGVLSATRMLTHDIMELTVTIEAPLREEGGHYKAGQYADITFPGISHPRAYSFAAAPEDDKRNELTFFIRKVPNGELTGWLFDDDRTGSPVTISGPYGSFWLREGEGPVVCIAGGSGMSSIKALLEHAVKVGCARDIVYLFGARTQADLYCMDEMHALESQWNSGRTMRFVPVLSDEPDDSDWHGLRGMVTEHIAGQFQDWSSAQAYLCGPPPMIDAAIKSLKLQGITDSDIHFDKFLDASSMPNGRQ